MTRQDQLSEWTAMVSSNLPQLSKPQALVLAWWSFGIVMTRSCGRTTVAAFLALLLGKKASTIAQRLREWCYPVERKRGKQRQELDVSSCFAALLAWVLRLWPCNTLALTIDATTLSNRFAVLVVSVVYRGCAIPVAWAILPQQQRGEWRSSWLRLLRLLRPAVPADMSVIVLADRGLYARWLFRRIVRLGWHPFLRVNPHTTFRVSNQSRWYRMREFTPIPGSSWKASGEAFKTAEARLACTLLCWWAEGYKDPWCVLTDLEPGQADVAWYGLRSWCEQSFKTTKRGAWQWQSTRTSDPERASRLWLALAVATLWMISVGSELEDALADATEADLHTLLKQSANAGRRQIRLVRLGLLWLSVRLLQGLAIPLPKPLEPEPWPETPPEHTRCFFLEGHASTIENLP